MLTNQILKLNSSNERIKVNKENYEQMLREKDAAKKNRGEDGRYDFIILLFANRSRIIILLIELLKI
jgi:hypothetical protein